MANFFADWRNSVLIVGIAGTLVFGALWIKSIPSTVIIVGNKSFTEKDVVKYLKDTAGFQVVRDMVNNALFEEYAAAQNISVTDSEADQLLTYNKRRLEMQNQSLDEWLTNQGITLSTYKRSLSSLALQTKLLVTPQEMKTAVDEVAKEGTLPFTVPPRYSYRFYTFADKNSALAGHKELMQNPTENCDQVANESLNPGVSKRDMNYFPGLAPKDDPTEKFLNSSLTPLKPGESNQPAPLPWNKNQYGFFLLRDFTPAQKPTYENSNIAVGYYYYFPKNAQSLAKRIQDLEGKALDKSTPQFFSTDYDMVKNYFEDLKKKNPVLPTIPSNLNPPAPAPVPSPGKAPAAGK